MVLDRDDRPPAFALAKTTERGASVATAMWSALNEPEPRPRRPQRPHRRVANSAARPAGLRYMGELLAGERMPAVAHARRDTRRAVPAGRVITTASG